MHDLRTWLASELAGNTLGRWLTALGALLVSIAVLYLAKSIARRRLSLIAPKTKSRADDVALALVERTTVVFMVLTGVWLSSWLLELPAEWAARLRVAALIVAILQAGSWAAAVVRVLTSAIGGTPSGSAQATGQAVLRFLGLMVVWLVVVLLCLANLGIDVTALVAGLGVGGVAVALAVQNILGDLFASISILLDEPFRVGDFITVGDLAGTVEKIGVKTTRVKSLSGEQLVFSNSDLLQSRIRNYQLMSERRVVLTLGVVMETPRAKLEQVPVILREVVAGLSDARLDRAHLSRLSPSSIDFELAYFVTSGDYTLYMDVQQRLLLEVLERLRGAGIALAYPTHLALQRQAS